MIAPHSASGCLQNVLVLQGGGALGAYQVGAFEALYATDFEPHWVAGISIGAINAAIIAGNRPSDRFDKLKTFWSRASSQVALPENPWITDRDTAAALTEWNAGVIMLAGVPGFFRPRVPPIPFQPADDLTKLSFYDTTPLHDTLLELVDFDLINHREGMRLSVGAVDVESGQQHYFDNRDRVSGRPAVRIGPEHIMASAALPPGFPAVKIGKTYYWDGGLTSNTPLDHVLAQRLRDDLVIVQLDLFSAKGALPRSLGEIAEREKDIRFASRTAVNAKKDRKLRNAAADGEGRRSVLHLIYRSAIPEVASRDYNFSPSAIAEHWRVGREDVERAMGNRGWMQPPDDADMVEYIQRECDVAPVRRA